jgi:hypothetical protein
MYSGWGSWRLGSVVSKINNDQRVKITREVLTVRELRKELSGRVEHFLEGYDVLNWNRSQIMHSTVAASTPTQDIFMKTQRDGRSAGRGVPLEELRLMADSMRYFTLFGKVLTNCLAHEASAVQDDALVPLPDTPRMPQRWNYTTGPIPFR